MPRFHSPALAIAVTTLAVGAAPAAALPIDPPTPGNDATTRVTAHDYGAYGASAGGLAAPSDFAARLQSPAPSQVQSTDTGVDWGSAALGGGAIGILALGSLGAVAIVGRRRVPRTR